MTHDIELKGITWGHSRGYTPMVAASQRFAELHPGVSITWQQRTLQEFADYPVEKLTTQYDLLIIDHPWAGCAAATQCVIPLNEWLPATYLDDQRSNQVGGSHESYHYNGGQWALAIDAATPVASYRQDLLEKNDTRLPATWQDVLELAAKGRIAVPAIPIDLLMNFYMFCLAHGKTPFATDHEVIDMSTGLQVLTTMQQLYGRIDKEMYSWNPVAVAERMSATDDYWYCPFAYGYSNYSRDGYAEKLLHYTDLVLFDGKPLQSTLGGTGLAISQQCSEKEWALRFVAWVCSPVIQTTLYTAHGGQPAHRMAWLDEQANGYCHHYFTETLPALNNSYMRPRYNGYLYFQDHAGAPLQTYLRDGGDPARVLEKMNLLYRESKK